MVFQHIQRIWKYLVFISLLAVLLIILSLNKLGYKMNIQMLIIQSSFSRMEHEMKPSCINVTDKMVLGSWKPDKLKQAEMAAVLNIHKIIRTYYEIPQTLQLPDNRCGNVNLDGRSTRGISKFRALCDPNGTTPCCFENKCVLKTVKECRCKNCYDLRQKLHAELSTWIPADPTCKITMFSGEEDACKVLKDMSIFFIGDSFIRQLDIAVLSLIRKNKPYGPLIKETPADKIQFCNKHGRLLTYCKDWIRFNTSECNNTTNLRELPFWQASEINDTVKYIQELQGQPNTLVIISVGLHFQFNVVVIENQVLNPILLLLSRSPWPKLIWLSAQAPGLLKSPSYIYQQRDMALQYNLRVNDILRQKGIPILDFFQMTEPVMSFDGTHHGAGVTDVMAQILLNYILEMRTSV